MDEVNYLFMIFHRNGVRGICANCAHVIMEWNGMKWNGIAMVFG